MGEAALLVACGLLVLAAGLGLGMRPTPLRIGLAMLAGIVAGATLAAVLLP